MLWFDDVSPSTFCNVLGSVLNQENSASWLNLVQHPRKLSKSLFLWKFLPRESRRLNGYEKVLMKKCTFMQHVGFSGMLLRWVLLSKALACVLPDVGSIKKLTAYQQRKWPQKIGTGRSKEGGELSRWQEDRRAMGSGSMSNKKRICFCIVQLNCSWSHCLQNCCKQCWGITHISAVGWYSSSSVSGYIFQDRNGKLGHPLSRLERDKDWSRLIECCFSVHT